MQIQPVGRIYGVSHHNSELFSLRRLLSVVKGATSFEDLATVDGEVHESFRSACMARGMQADDGEIIAAMREIIDVTVSVDAIRHHFARLLINSAPADPPNDPMADAAAFATAVNPLIDNREGADPSAIRVGPLYFMFLVTPPSIKAPPNAFATAPRLSAMS